MRTLDGHRNVRIDHEPECAPDFHVPVSTPRNADSSMSAIGDFVESGVAAVHVPEYPPLRPVTVARQAPFHDWGDLLADHPPRNKILPETSYRAEYRSRHR